MRLYLLRHTEAADTNPDRDRKLTSKGRRDADALGRLLQRQGAKLPALIWCSPFVRARETLAHVLAAAESEVVPVERGDLTPYDDPAALLPELAELEEDLLIVGHNPHLALLGGYLLAGISGQPALHVRKGGLLRFQRVRHASAQADPTWVLDWMLAPKLYRRQSAG